MVYEVETRASRGGSPLPTTLDTFESRLAYAVGKIGKDKSAEAMGRDGRSVSRYLSGASEPPFSAIARLAHASDVHMKWLATGEGPRDSRVESAHTGTRTKEEQTEEEIRAMRPDELDEQAFVVMPLLDLSAAAGSGRLTQDFPEVRGMVALGEDYLRSIGVSPRFAQLLEIDGDSMFPTLKDRDIAVVDTSITEVRSDAVYAVVYGGLVVAKRVQINRDGSILLSSDNKTAGYRDERVAAGDLHDLRIAGRIKGRVGGL